MRLHLQHIGPLREATIDLAHDFILLTGPNGTGKTFAAYCVYNWLIFKIVADISDSKLPIKKIENDLTIEGEFVDLILSYNSNIEKKCNESLSNLFAQPKTLFKDSKVLGIYNDKEINTLKNMNYFGLFTGQLMLIIDGKFTAHIQNDTCPIIDTLIWYGYNDKILNEELLYPYIFPTERVTLSSLHKSLKPNYADKNLVSRYKKPILDHLEMLNDMASLSKNTSELAFLADWLETELLKGKITMSQYGELRFKPTGDKKNYSISVSASITQSLASLVFYFRHLAKAGDRIIIDEPELNLHPDNQRIIARFLVRAMNAGVKILISTHSDHLIRELNNLMMLGSKRDDKKAKKLMREYKYKPEDLLDYTKVGAYLFLGDTCEQLEVEETGFEVATIDKAISDQNAASNSIYFTLFD